MLRLLFLFAVLAIAYAPDQASAKTVDWDKQIGVASLRRVEEGFCLEIDNPTLRSGNEVKLIFPDNKLQKVLEAEIKERRSGACFFPSQPEAGDDPSSDVAYYHLTVKDFSNEDVQAMNLGVAIALIGIDATFRTVKGKVRADLDRDGVDETFRVCGNTEGLSPTVWRGEPLKGRILWQGYYYLGYDIDGDCTEKDHPPAGR